VLYAVQLFSHVSVVLYICRSVHGACTPGARMCLAVEEECEDALFAMFCVLVSVERRA